MRKKAVRPCPICGAGDVEVLHTQRFSLPEGSPLPPTYDVVACPCCGFVYADTPTSQADYDLHYARFSKYEDPAVATGGGASTADRERLGKLAAHLSARVTADASVLDVGCAAGGLLIALRDRGLRKLRGIDASESCVAQVRAAGIPAICLPLSRLGKFGADERFDLVVLSHVLEHVRDLGTVADRVSALLAPGGLVYAETPDASRYGDHSFVPWYFFDPEHINHFDTERLSALARRNGLSAIESGEGTLEIAGAKTYPVCWAFLQVGPSAWDAAPDEGTRSLRDRVLAYAERCGVAPGFPELSRLAASGRPVIVWGAGSFAQRLFGEGALAGCCVVAVVDRDRNKQGRPLAGFSVETPEAAVARHPEAVVVVAVAVDDAAVVGDARRLCPEGEVVTLASNLAPRPASVGT